MDNRPPKHLRTLSRGDVREDGMVFDSYQPNCTNGERWVTPEKLEEIRQKNTACVKSIRKENPERRREQDRRSYRNPCYRLIKVQRTRIREALKGKLKSKKTVALLGCTAAEFKAHLESLFKEGMTWANYGEWHVDHIKPCSLFDLSLDKEQHVCFNYLNTQPLWAKENLQKRNKYKPQTKY